MAGIGGRKGRWARVLANFPPGSRRFCFYQKQIKNPVEAAFFLWLNLAYLQPFEDGNKRTSRLAANVPLMLYNCAPLSFLDVSVDDYVNAMLGVYEERNVALAVDLFHWTYRRSMHRYAVAHELAGLDVHNCARYRLPLAATRAWVAARRGQ